MSSTKEKESEVLRQFKMYMSNPENVKIAANNVFEKLVDDIILGVVFEVHHAAKTGLFDLEEGIQEENMNYQIDNSDEDIFGYQRIKKPKERICCCPTCKSKLAASKFAPHLANCMGLGRSSSRIASRRIANNNKDSGSYSGTISDDDDDNDDDDDVGWTAGSDRRRTKKRNKNNSRRSKTQKTVRNGDVAIENTANIEVSSSIVTSSNMNYDGMTHEEKKNLLTQICGVISEHTRRLCTRSMRCPQHSDEQRRAVRAALLASPVPEVNPSSDMIQVDVDTYEEGDGQSMRESLGCNWEQEHSNTSSPADSASTSSSSSKRKKLPKSKSKSSLKNHKNSQNFPNNNHVQRD